MYNQHIATHIHQNNYSNNYGMKDYSQTYCNYQGYDYSQNYINYGESNDPFSRDHLSKTNCQNPP